VTLTFDLLTLKVVSESRVTWAISMPILVFLGLSVLDLGPMYDCTRQTDVRQTSDAHHRLMSPPGTLDGGGGIIIISAVVCLRAERSDWHRFLLFSFQHSVPGCYDMFRILILFLCECLSVCLSFFYCIHCIALLWRINVFRNTVEIRCAGMSL